MVQESPDPKIAGLAHRVGQLERLTRFGIVGGDLELVLTTMQQHSILLGKLRNEVGSGNVLYGIEDPSTPDDIATHAALVAAHHAKYTDAEAIIAVEGHGDAYNGSFLEPMTFVVTSNGTTITGTIDKDPSGDLTERFSDGFSTLSSGGTVTLTVGSATVPKKNYIYVLQSNKGVLVASTSDWPSAEHIKVAEVVVQTAALVQSDGILVNRNWNDFAKGTDGQGHHPHAWERLRWEHSAYKSGSAVTWTGSGTAALDLAITAGKAYQLHLQSVSAFDTADPDNVYVVNHPTAYTITADIETLVVDSGNVSLSGRYYNLVIWQSVSSGSEAEKTFINLPSGSYKKQSDAENDVSGYDSFSIPNDYRGYAYLVQRVTIKHSTAAGGTWTIIQETDLRGTVPSVAVGGGTLAITTEFSDNAFKLFDEGDPTKEIAFQASGITAGNTRTITMPDKDVTLQAKTYDDVLAAGDDIQASLDAGNTKILLLDGTHTLSSDLTITTANTEIVGQTMRGTVIEPGANSVIFSGGPDFCSIRNLTIKDGSDATGSVQALGGVTGFLAERLYFTNNSGIGLLIGDNGSTAAQVRGCIFQQTAGTALRITDNTQVMSCDFNISSANGILCEDFDGKGAGRIRISNCWESAGNYGVKINGSGARVIVSACEFFTGSANLAVDHAAGRLTLTGGCMIIGGTSSTQSLVRLDAPAIVDGNYIDRNDYGVEVKSEDCVITSNLIRRSEVDGILINGNYDDCIITNNRIEGCAGYGVNIASALANNTLLTDNNLKGNTTGAFQDLGTDSRIRFNIEA